MEKLMNALAGTMTPPTAYGTVHIIIIIVGFAITISAAWFLRGLDERRNKMLLLIYAGVLIASEIFKQIFLYYVLCDGAICWGEFPFQMCSLPMYLCPIAVFTKNERLRDACYSFMMCFNMLGGLAGALEPSGVFHEHIVLTVHAVAWHFSLVFLSCYIIFSRRGGVSKQCYYDTVKLFVICCFIAFVINTLIGITVGVATNMFFVGPTPTSIIVFSDIASKYGWAASTVIYIPVTSLAAGFIFWLNQLKKEK